MSNSRLTTLLGILMGMSASYSAFAQDPPADTSLAAPPAVAAPAAPPTAVAPVASSGAAASPPVAGTPISLNDSARIGSIADTDIQKIFETREDLKPEFGFEDIFLTKESRAVLDTTKLGLPDNKSFCKQLTNLTLIEKGEEDASGGLAITVGKTAGTTQLLLYDGQVPDCKVRGPLLKVYRITVSDTDLVALLQEVKALIGQVEGIEIRIVGTQIVVDGQVIVTKDMRRVLTVLAKYKDKPVLNLVETSPLALKLLAEQMEERIAGGRDRNREINVKVVNGRFFLEGNVEKKIDRDVAEKICQSYIPDRYSLDAPAAGGKLDKVSFPSLGECVSMVRIRQGQAKEPDPIISVRIDFVTMNRAYIKNFDFRWAPGLSGGGSTDYSSDTGKFLTTFTGTLTSLFPKLDTIAKNGNARILKTATLLVRDGDDERNPGQPAQASLKEVLNLGFVIPGARAGDPPTAGNVPVETAVTIKARSISGGDLLNLGISASQTELKDFRKGEPPTTLANQIDTQIVVKDGESAALGGLISERRNVSYGRDPADSEKADINIFKLSRAHNFADDKSQFIIFVTPKKLRSTAEGTETLKRKFRLRK